MDVANIRPSPPLTGCVQLRLAIGRWGFTDVSGLCALRARGWRAQSAAREKIGPSARQTTLTCHDRGSEAPIMRTNLLPADHLRGLNLGVGRRSPSGPPGEAPLEIAGDGTSQRSVVDTVSRCLPTNVQAETQRDVERSVNPLCVLVSETTDRVGRCVRHIVARGIILLLGIVCLRRC
jgi:hypothetical protein